MESFRRNRPRALVVCRDAEVRDDLVAMLTAHGYYADHVENRSDAMASYRAYKQPIVIMDTASVPRSPHRLLRYLRIYRRNVIVLVAAWKGDERRVYPYLRTGVYDIIHLPIDATYLHAILRRLTEYSQLTACREFTRLFGRLALMMIPLCGLLIYVAVTMWF